MWGRFADISHAFGKSPRSSFESSPEVQLGMVRKRDNHIYPKKWVQILGPEGGHCNGMLKVSVFAYGTAKPRSPGDR